FRDWAIHRDASALEDPGKRSCPCSRPAIEAEVRRGCDGNIHRLSAVIESRRRAHNAAWSRDHCQKILRRKVGDEGGRYVWRNRMTDGPVVTPTTPGVLSAGGAALRRGGGDCVI